MRMRNPLKHKSKRKQFLELQEDRGFTAGQFEAPEPQSKKDNNNNIYTF